MYIKLLLVIASLHLGLLIEAQQIIIQPYLQNASPSSMTIMWEADNVGNGAVHWGVSPFALSDSTSSITQIGNGFTQIHTTILTDLLADQKYYYSIKMQDQTTSNLYHFKTLPNPNTESSTQLIAISDMQLDGSHPNKYAEIVNDGVIAIVDSIISPDMSNLDAILFPGDLVASGGTYNQWKDHFFNPSDSLTPFVPMYPVPGNHDYGDGTLQNFLKYFTLPDNGPIGLEDQVWYKDISNIRIIGLNSNSGTADKISQLNWMDDILTGACTNENIDFVFAELHHPYKSELWTPGESDFTGEVVGKLENFTENCSKPSLHFFGHTHAYSRGQSANHEHLWVNVATASGAIDNWGEFPNADYPEFSKSQDEYGFVLVQVEAGDEPSLTLKRFGRGDQDIIQDNILRDEITLKKIEFPPYTPVNIFPKGQSIEANCLILKASQFYGVEDEHQATQWQVALNGDFQNSLVAQKWLQSENFYNEINTQLNDDLTDVEIEDLATNITYHWRVRYRDQYLKWSDWSVPGTFYLFDEDVIVSANLILNNGAENGITNWTGDIESIENGDCNSVPPYQDTHNFAVGGVCANESDAGFAEQIIDLNAYATDIDNDFLSVKLSGYMRDYSGSDIPELYCEFYDNSSLLSTTPTISNATSVWTNRVLIVEIPVGTRSCKVILKGTRNSGTDNDSYFDELSLFITNRINCPNCFGNTNIDMDGDGFCNDLDCNDNDPDIYPGALELCDEMDNNCDGRLDSGDTVIWTGAGLLPIWSDGDNWNQTFIPLSCQHVLIPTGFNVGVSNTFACKSLEIGTGSELLINPKSLLVVNSHSNISVPSIQIFGVLKIEGKVLVKGYSPFSVIVQTGGEIEIKGKMEFD